MLAEADTSSHGSMHASVKAASNLPVPDANGPEVVGPACPIRLKTTVQLQEQLKKHEEDVLAFSEPGLSRVKSAAAMHDALNMVPCSILFEDLVYSVSSVKELFEMAVWPTCQLVQ